jgi:DNA replication protein DnaC
MGNVTPRTLKRAAVPSEYWDDRIGTIPEECAYKEVVLRYVESAADHVRAGRGVYFYGESGMGKSGAAAIIAKAAIDSGVTVLWLPVADIVALCDVRNEFSPDLKYIDRVMQVNLLILDGLGDEFPAEPGRAQVRRILSLRAERGRATIVTAENSILDRYSKPGKQGQVRPSWFSQTYSARLAKRMRGVLHPVECAGHDWRAEKVTGLRDALLGED